ncbi:MAG: hypothetical protein A2Y77_17090 [Planctomycetes bacterium RBG_13_62_9]|nr:MAG: hypothetical protein A2Y77_17090 [Planctomycetes bacterium RBG_13_62_9]
MLTLIGREISDHVAYVLGCCVISLMITGITIYDLLWETEPISLGLCGTLAFFLFASFLSLGVAQMYGDRANRISSLLSTMAVTRTRILAARVLVGVLVVVGSVVLFVVPVAIVLQMIASPQGVYRRIVEFYSHTILEVLTSFVLISLACYCIGLQVGWTTNKVRLLLGSLLLLALILSLVWIKGPGPQAMLILVVFIAAALGHTWYRFTSASL